MNRSTALANLMRGVGEDVRDYQMLRTLLQQQFDAALAHQAVRLSELAERITEMTGVMEQRRLQRVDLVNALSGKGGSVTTAFALLPGTPRDALQAGWNALEALVRECKELNERNCRLMMDQYSIMQRVLHGEEETYVPA
ncbi:MAG TPA: flagellar export chaperone FlgN [Burkholderiaceae bacterium]|nr:flagellar export chaperone FlgN [Burkholderiaceae bacterium]